MELLDTKACESRLHHLCLPGPRVVGCLSLPPAASRESLPHSQALGDLHESSASMAPTPSLRAPWSYLRVLFSCAQVYRDSQ
jgi:hypothetical protein